MKPVGKLFFGITALSLMLSTAPSWGQELRPLVELIEASPSCAQVVRAIDPAGAMVITCGVTGTNNALLGITFDLASSDAPSLAALGGLVIGSPSCDAVGGGGQVTCGVRGTDNQLYAITFDPRDPAARTQFFPLGGEIVSSPSCATNADLDVICGVVGKDNKLSGIRFNPISGAKRGEQLVGGLVIGSPSCAATLESLTCGVRGTDNQLHLFTFEPASGFLREFPSLGGEIIDDPSCATSGQAVITCAVRWKDNTLRAIQFDFSQSTDFRPLGGLIVTAPSCVQGARSAEVTCGVVGTDNRLYAIRFDITDSGTPNTGFIFMSPPDFVIDAPSCVRVQARGLNFACVVRSMDNVPFSTSAFSLD